ncbi:hypothetical protein [Hymenobacter cavernae]|uniref:Glyoxalase n=1 Tax=Hymenobacter cavernae TaxID=2044852 RepID=A0ABQ1TLY0_9BACT|nr:hypothetical protein [Hymenobacter cavernae]GGE98592.1 hypothetical protein GCM10011383_06780 [Hymenobacter cavernae]
MSDRTTALLALRPVVAAELPDVPTATVGDFLHRTLRPVLKLQNDVLLLLVADFVREHHIPFARAGAAERERLIAELLTRNVKLRYTIIGIISGLFTADETAFYRQHRAELNRRLLELATQRVQSQAAAVAEQLALANSDE